MGYNTATRSSGLLYKQVQKETKLALVLGCAAFMDAAPRKMRRPQGEGRGSTRKTRK